jgi:hypothetical protein
VPDRLPVHANRQQLHSLEVPASFETSDSFVIEVTNHGESCRLHVVLDGELAEVATIAESNHYIEANATREIPVSVHDKRSVFGKIKVVVGYGATTRWVDVELTEPADENREVQVDEDLGKPQPSDEGETDGSLGSSVTDRPGIPVFALGFVALLVAVTAAMLSQSIVVAAGAAVVIVAVAVAVYLLAT